MISVTGIDAVSVEKRTKQCPFGDSGSVLLVFVIFSWVFILSLTVLISQLLMVKKELELLGGP